MHQHARSKRHGSHLPVYDVLFRTYYMPKDRLPAQFGLKGEDVPEGIWGQMLYPFRRREVKAA